MADTTISTASPACQPVFPGAVLAEETRTDIADLPLKRGIRALVPLIRRITDFKRDPAASAAYVIQKT